VNAPAARPASTYRAWIPAVVLICVGLAFLVRNYFGQEIHNWWALFILIPSFILAQRGYSSLQVGRNAEAFGQLSGALVLAGLIVVFLFEFSFGPLWPIFLIIGGISLLASRLWRT
jgi:hypothetical protein